MTKKLPGHVPDMSNEAYHSHAAIGASGLKLFSVTPSHYWAAYIDPERVEKDAKHFRIGRAWHCAVFEPFAFDDRFATNHDAHPATKRAKMLEDAISGALDASTLVALPEGLSTTTKEGKALIADLQAEGKTPADTADVAFISEWLPKLRGRDILSADNIAKVLKMAKIARNLPVSRVVFDQYGRHGAAEQSLFWTEPETGVSLKIRPDYMLLPCAAFPDGLIIDGKSTTDASADGFGRQSWGLDYGMQAALYPMVYQAVFKTKQRPAFLWLAQEKESPFAAQYFSAQPELVAHYENKILQLLPSVAACQRSGVWPGYPETVAPLDMPAWAQRAIANDNDDQIIGYVGKVA